MNPPSFFSVDVDDDAKTLDVTVFVSYFTFSLRSMGIPEDPW